MFLFIFSPSSQAQEYFSVQAITDTEDISMGLGAHSFFKLHWDNDLELGDGVKFSFVRMINKSFQYLIPIEGVDSKVTEVYRSLTLDLDYHLFARYHLSLFSFKAGAGVKGRYFNYSTRFAKSTVFSERREIFLLGLVPSLGISVPLSRSFEAGINIENHFFTSKWGSFETYGPNSVAIEFQLIFAINS